MIDNDDRGLTIKEEDRLGVYSHSTNESCSVFLSPYERNSWMNEIIFSHSALDPLGQDQSGSVFVFRFLSVISKAFPPQNKFRVEEEG